MKNYDVAIVGAGPGGIYAEPLSVRDPEEFMRLMSL